MRLAAVILAATLLSGAGTAWAQSSPGVPNLAPDAETSNITPGYDSTADTHDVCSRIAKTRSGSWIVRKPIQLTTGNAADYSVLRYETGQTVANGHLPSVGDLNRLCPQAHQAS